MRHPVALTLLLTLAAFPACGGAPPPEPSAAAAAAAIDRDGDARVDRRELEAFLRRHSSPGADDAWAASTASLIMAACAGADAEVLQTDAERTCLASQRPHALPGPTVASLASHRPARSWSRVLALVAVALLGLLLAPFAVDRGVRMLGWLLKPRTRGAWFRLPAALLWPAAVLIALFVAWLAAAALLASGTWWPARIAAYGPLRLPALTRPLDPEWVLVFVIVVAGLVRGYRLSDAARRIRGLEPTPRRGPTQAPAATAPMVLGDDMDLRPGGPGEDTPVLRHDRGAAPDRRAPPRSEPEPPRLSLAATPPARRHPRRIVICCDGTGNRADAVEEGRRSVSNVRKFFERVVPHADSQWDQSAWYDEGVATETSGGAHRLARLARIVGRLGAVLPARLASTLHRLRMIAELAFGVGITENITQGYREIVARYEPGDQIFLIGFSRGAYTARCIAGVISRAGILRADHVRFAPDVVQLYRYRPQPEDPITVRPDLVHQDAGVEFLGLFDTVSSLGVPLWGWSFSIGGLWSNQALDTSPAAACRIVRHAVSIDEERSQFMPTLFDEGMQRHRQAVARGEAQAGQHVRQMWFRGSHAGVGGGYADADLSDVALEWMLDEAAAAGLRFSPEPEPQPRPQPLGQIHKQLDRQPFWQLSGSWPRWHPCVAPTAADPYPSSGFGVLHPSVITRATHAAWLRDPSSPVGGDELHVVSENPATAATIRVRADLPWNRTGIVLEGGGSYRITYLDGAWQDKECPRCGPAGQKPSSPWDLRRLAGWGRRAHDADWLELLLHVAHPRPWPLLELPGRRLLAYMLWRDPQELRRTLIRAGRRLLQPGDYVDIRLECPTGMLYAFANDWWLAYRNNSGSILLGVERIADTEIPHFVVGADGRAR